MTTTDEVGAVSSSTDGSYGHIYSWGANSYGQLGHGDKEDRLVPQKIRFFVSGSKIKQITGGGGHTLCLTEENKLLVCGSNNRGQLGLNHTNDVTQLTPVPDLAHVNVIQAVGGWDFTLAVARETKGDILYSWGSNSFCQLGRSSHPSNFASKPDVVDLGVEDVRIKDICAGLRHCLLVTDTGHVYVWGQGKKGQLGFCLADKSVPKVVEQPTKISLSESIKKSFCGSFHSGALSESGHIYMWGCNKFGQLGQDKSIVSISQPNLVHDQSLHNKVIHVVSGWTHVVAITVDKMVYTWGRGDYGQLGRKIDTSHDPIPTLIPGVFDIHTVVCGSEHNLAVDERRRLISWGWNEHGICGSGNEENLLEPAIVKSLEDVNICHVGSGAGHCFVMVAKSS